jgi:hypothetical protein
MTEANKREQYLLELEEKHKNHKERCKKYYYENHETELQKRTELRQNEEYKLMMEKYRQSEAGKKSARISCWKQVGVKSDDYDMIYDEWKNTTHCEECSIELIEGNKGENRKVLDHDHKTGLFRNILCHRCNVIRGIEDGGVIKQTKAQYNENRKWKRWEQDFRLKWDLKKAFNAISQF